MAAQAVAGPAPGPTFARMTFLPQLLFLPLLLALLLASCATTRPQTLNALRLAVDVPGVKQVRDSLFLDETEVANLHWLEYLHFVRRDSSDAFYRAQLPDSTAQPRLRGNVTKGVATGDTASYLRHPAYRYYPVVGITHAQATNYCRWRTAVVRQLMPGPAPHRARTAYAAAHRKLLAAYDVRATYRLPTPAEWELAASLPAAPNVPAARTALADINANAANSLGIRNLAGNVAELTALPSVVKGGSWFQPGVPTAADVRNSGPRAWLGFRCACDVEVQPKTLGR